MPELPEVEVVRAGLERHVVGARLGAVEVLHPRPVRRDPRGPAGFAAALEGRRVEAARRRGKYFWLSLDSGDALLGHLGMSVHVEASDSSVERGVIEDSAGSGTRRGRLSSRNPGAGACEERRDRGFWRQRR